MGAIVRGEREGFERKNRYIQIDQKRERDRQTDRQTETDRDSKK